MYSTEGIVIKEEDYGEADRFFTILTKDYGKIRVMAKGIRKIKAKLRSGLQVLSQIYLEFVQGKYFYTAIEAISLDDFKIIKDNPEKLKSAFYVLFILDKLIREGKDDRIWLLASKILKKIEEEKISGPKLDLLLRYFEWNLFDILGYHPELYKCQVCRKKLKEEKLYFSARGGGALCGICRKKDKESEEIDINTLKILRLILGRKKEILEKLKPGPEKGLKKISSQYLEHILEEKINVV